jgi:peptidoglycan/LPS O-acetylase OafA/YrhL
MTFAPVIIVWMIMLGAAGVLNRKPQSAHRFVAIDGLRGHLATFVFLHHAVVWFQYARTGTWSAPSETVFVQLGQCAVAMFFMITGFLFASKLLDARGIGLDWTKLYVSRVMRLVPLYFVAMALLVAVVGAISGWRLHEPLDELLGGVLSWLAFTVYTAPDLNGVEHTAIIVAGVTWTLAYEWLFYLALPLMAPGFGVRVPNLLFLASLSIIALVVLTTPPSPLTCAYFAPGIAAAVVAKSVALRRFAATRWASLLVVAFLAAAYTRFTTAEAAGCFALLSAAFILVAAGCSVFGFLATRASRCLGELSYGIYLLHGIVLYTFMRFVVGFDRAASFDWMGYWVAMALVAVALACLTTLTFKWIEYPAMRRAAPMIDRLRGVATVVQIVGDECSASTGSADGGSRARS